MLQKSNENGLRFCAPEVRCETPPLSIMLHVICPWIKLIAGHVAVEVSRSQALRQASLRAQLPVELKVVHDLVRQQGIVVDSSAPYPFQVKLIRLLVVIAEPAAHKQCCAKVREPVVTNEYSGLQRAMVSTLPLLQLLLPLTCAQVGRYAADAASAAGTARPPVVTSPVRVTLRRRLTLRHHAAALSCDASALTAPRPRR
eukprot:CAMPEP_0115718928 /NCGR_PEP_ID=MMETSP0272-20121206/77701_1 /TAXON_ID=71861 /ORGANISM="Scrippsiella trochoidea, Strain CCMP3099" /LENGTH=199 /DNA_ID=CAMNT_0003161507 /DNA_START=704 /DNA_END=1300 /DNA_ORIENTATION=+